MDREIDPKWTGKDTLPNVQVNLVNGGDPEWRLLIDGAEMRGVTDVQIRHSMDSAIEITVTFMASSVKGIK